MRKDQRGFVLNGLALLLILPAILLAGIGLRLTAIGQEAVSLQMAADKVFYTAHDLERIIKLAWKENLFFDNKENANRYFTYLKENCQLATGLLIDITPNWMLWTRAENGLVPEGIRDSYAGGPYCKIARSGDNLIYYFEAYQITLDYDDIVLRVSKVGENLRVNIMSFDPVENWPIDVYHENTLLWDDATPNNVGENKDVARTTQLIVSISVSDPAGAARHHSVIELG